MKLLTYRVAEMISIDLQPFSVVEDTGFIRLVAELDSRFVLPSRRYLTIVVVPEIHAKAKFKVTELLGSTKYISMTTDIWTSTNSHHSFLSLTAHFVVPKTMEKDYAKCLAVLRVTYRSKYLSSCIVTCTGMGY